MDTGDASYIKQLNRRILIEEIIKNISLSRSDLSRNTGLNKATISVQVNELINENIVIEKTEGESVSRGRKPILLEINGGAGYSVGIDIDEHSILLAFCDLKGELFHKTWVPLETIDFEEVMEQLMNHLTPAITQFNEQYKPIGLIGIGVGVHGIVSNENEIIYTPKQQWSRLHVENVLKETYNKPVYVDNNANLCVFAEQVYYEHIPDLFCITLYSGIGLGIINNHNIYRGYQGFAGEIGHMIVEPKGIPCPCGNKGCWELYASEKALKKQLNEKYPELSPQESIQQILEEGVDSEVLDYYLDYLSIGLNNIINIFNPEKIILNGAFINGHTDFINNLERKLTSKFNNYLQIRASFLGDNACALGGAAVALKNFFGVNMLNHVNYHYFKSDLLEI
ncbi:ROK family transcriptional regulator [Alteribacillus bidgolensis]|uniref:Sugar kinase of the NBD/HSP70 family, may contain an N-terminal HTH domain n=1 Tax=Alteribacillus bidgolensis TaxID=930129 RepID=A0A1G8I3M1_9BACI|nr:ROK family transcriptional regulator [Alteribacillus bidgolensis]SDI13556.1 Sugar kinase of the NBD/HSP70 family, may contain an N-terminal HTH domain [Alteribacillus bidgolensis]